MRLIDADLLLEEINSFSMRITGLSSAMAITIMEETKKSIAKMVDEQPTAYDVDKVLEQIEELQGKTVTIESDAVPVFNYKGGFEGFTKTCEIEKEFVDKKKIIEIAKSGGIECKR